MLCRHVQATNASSFSVCAHHSGAAAAVLPCVNSIVSGISISSEAQHTCVLMSYGAVRCWGYNLYGQLGDGTASNKLSPPLLDVMISGTVTAVAVGGLHTCVLLSSGDVRCWGYNLHGQLGYGDTSIRTSPPTTNVNVGAAVSAIATGEAFTCVLTVSGGVRCWGYNLKGQLGDGSTISRVSPPTKNVALLGPTAYISTGQSFACALLTDASVQCWGLNDAGQLGYGDTSQRASPGALLSLAPALSIKK